MKKQLLMLGIIFTATVAMAATPDFSGTWARDNANSDPVPNQMYWMTRVAPAAPRPAAGTVLGAAPGAAPAAARAAGGGQRAPQLTLLTIHQDAGTLHVIDPQSTIHEYTLVGDGSPHTKPMDTGIQNAVVTAKLQADSLVIETTEPFGGMPGNVAAKIKEVWSLSPDGKTLTITTTRDIPARHQEYKEVYTRTEAQPGTICSDGCIVRK
jgi:hypothetical protein